MIHYSSINHIGYISSDFGRGGPSSLDNIHSSYFNRVTRFDVEGIFKERVGYRSQTIHSSYHNPGAVLEC